SRGGAVGIEDRHGLVEPERSSRAVGSARSQCDDLDPWSTTAVVVNSDVDPLLAPVDDRALPSADADARWPVATLLEESEARSYPLDVAVEVGAQGVTLPQMGDPRSGRRATRLSDPDVADSQPCNLGPEQAAWERSRASR